MSAVSRAAVYVHALNQIPGWGTRAIQRITKAFPDPDGLLHASTASLEQHLGIKLAGALQARIGSDWSAHWQSSQDALARHVEKNIVPIAITENSYPTLLKKITDAPVLLYAQGHLGALENVDTVAVVGTRGPTELGRDVARRVTKHFAKSGYAIISGLAKGIDTCAHQSALEVEGVTIAVLGTSLDKIYPAENRPLAEKITAQGGVVLTEIEMGKPSFRNAFVQRDRIQSGLSLAVIAVQTGVTGGTMHTVEFARKQGRLLFCPRPLKTEEDAEQYAGIWELIRSGAAKGFDASSYDDVSRELQLHKHGLLHSGNHEDISLRTGPGQPVQIGLELTALTTEAEEIVAACRRLGLNADATQFDDTMRQVRKRLFGA